MKIVHAADLHIDSPLRGLDRYEGAPVERLRGATRRAVENLVALCIDESADLLLLAGDVFDGTWKDYSTGLFFVAQMARLREAAVPVVLLRGNHDAASAVAKALRLPDNVKELSARKPETYALPRVPIAVHGQSFGARVVSEDLAAKYPPRVPGAFNIGVLHTSIDGREGHEPYAPTSIETMRSKGYDYWALGHVHAREVVSTDPPIVYPGNLQGRHARETGPKGATLIVVDDDTRVVERLEHRVLDVVRWERIAVDVSAEATAALVIERIRSELAGRAAELEGRILAVRIAIQGRTPANSAIRRDEERFLAELRAAAIDGLGEAVWLEKILIETEAPIDLERLRAEESAVGHLARRLASIKEDPAELGELAGIFSELDKRLPVELREAEGEAGLRLGDPATIRGLLADVEQMLLPRLLEGRDPSLESGTDDRGKAS